MKKDYYIASCVFTAWHTDLSRKIQNYVKDRFGMTVVRCCMPDFRVREYADQMPEEYRRTWLSLPNTANFKNAGTICTVCHNCYNLIQDTQPDLRCLSLWELILSDKDFIYPDYQQQAMYLQDCWRSRENRAEQQAVRALMKKMNIRIIELTDNFDRTEFCGRSYYKLQFIRKSRRAPENHPLNIHPELPAPSEAEQAAMMREYCRSFADTSVACYCHYCLEGLKLGGADGHHLAKLLFILQ